MLLQAAEAPDAWKTPATASTVLPVAPLDSIPEEQAAWNSPRNVSEEDHTLPGEIPVPEGDMDASPFSDDEMDPADPNFHPTAQQLVDLKIAHDNSGHPTAKDFARMIKLGNGKPELVRWVKHHFKCDDCEANKRPKSRRPSAVPKTYRFNHVVGIDLLEVKDPVV